MKTYEVEVIVSTDVYVSEKGHSIGRAGCQEGAREFWKIRAPSERMANVYAKHYVYRPNDKGDNEIGVTKEICGCQYCKGEE